VPTGPAERHRRNEPDEQDGPDGRAAGPAARRVLLDPSGPVLVEGPVEVRLPDGTVARSDRFMVAVCACRRSMSYPWCDTSHRRRSREHGPPDAHRRDNRSAERHPEG
jgi:CDGSH-type Zn-finger protein